MSHRPGPHSGQISRYNPDTGHFDWIDATPDEYAAWRATRAAKAAATRAAKADRAPAGAGAKGGKRSGARPRPSAGAAADAPDTETLDGSGSGAIHAAAKAASRQGSARDTGGPLTPILGLVSRLAAMGLIRVTHTLTAARHPMLPAEAVSVAAPALRIANRELGKRVKWTPKSGPNTRDLEQLGMGLVTYVLRGMGAQATPAAPGPMPRPNLADENMSFGGMPERAPFLASTAATETVSDVTDDRDLFSGSEPLGPGTLGRPASAANFASTPATRQQPAGPPGAVSVPDSVWNAISPPERGLAEVMA